MGDFDLGGAERPAYELATSAEPCAMCLGAVPWSGVRHLSCAARGEDAEAIGFDEGDKPRDWPRTLEERGISVARDVLRDDGRRGVARVRREGRRHLQTVGSLPREVPTGLPEPEPFREARQVAAAVLGHDDEVFYAHAANLRVVDAGFDGHDVAGF